MTTPRSTPIARAHTLFDCTPLLLARLPAVDSRKAKPDNGVHPRMLSYSPTEGDEEPILCTSTPAVRQASNRHHTGCGPTTARSSGAWPPAEREVECRDVV